MRITSTFAIRSTPTSEEHGVNEKSVAVIGSGVAGLTAAYLLQRRYAVTLFESEDRLGGHAHTHDVTTPDAGMVPVDSGFIVYNRVTYPHLVRLFDDLGVATQPTQMSMSVSCEGCGLSYAGGKGIGGIFASPRSATRPAFLRMLIEVRKFHRAARGLLTDGSEELTLAEFVDRGGYTRYFTSHFLVPVIAAVWSVAPAVALGYPARYLFGFLANHGMLSVHGSHPWRTVVGGSRTYVERAVKHLTAVSTSTPVRTIERSADRVVVRDDADERHVFDKVVVATHADTALTLLADPSPTERAVLGAFTYSHNDTALHTDERLLPESRRAGSSWNYLLPGCDTTPDRVLVSYDMNRLQALPTRTPHVVTLNTGRPLRAGSLLARMAYSHPIYTRESVAAQSRLPELTTDRITFAGAYHGWGFHEDGCRSGVEAAAAFGVIW